MLSTQISIKSVTERKGKILVETSDGHQWEFVKGAKASFELADETFSFDKLIDLTEISGSIEEIQAGISKQLKALKGTVLLASEKNAHQYVESLNEVYEPLKAIASELKSQYTDITEYAAHVQAKFALVDALNSDFGGQFNMDSDAAVLIARAEEALTTPVSYQSQVNSANLVGTATIELALSNGLLYYLELDVTYKAEMSYWDNSIEQVKVGPFVVVEKKLFSNSLYSSVSCTKITNKVDTVLNAESVAALKNSNVILECVIGHKELTLSAEPNAVYDNRHYAGQMTDTEKLTTRAVRVISKTVKDNGIEIITDEWAGGRTILAPLASVSGQFVSYHRLAALGVQAMPAGFKSVDLLSRGAVSITDEQDNEHCLSSDDLDIQPLVFCRCGYPPDVTYELAEKLQVGDVVGNVYMDDRSQLIDAYHTHNFSGNKRALSRAKSPLVKVDDAEPEKKWIIVTKVVKDDFSVTITTNEGGERPFTLYRAKPQLFRDQWVDFWDMLGSVGSRLLAEGYRFNFSADGNLLVVKGGETVAIFNVPNSLPKLYSAPYTSGLFYFENAKDLKAGDIVGYVEVFHVMKDPSTQEEFMCNGNGGFMFPLEERPYRDEWDKKYYDIKSAAQGISSKAWPEYVAYFKNNYCDRLLPREGGGISMQRARSANSNATPSRDHQERIAKCFDHQRLKKNIHLGVRCIRELMFEYGAVQTPDGIVPERVISLWVVDSPDYGVALYIFADYERAFHWATTVNADLKANRKEALFFAIHDQGDVWAESADICIRAIEKAWLAWDGSNEDFIADLLSRKRAGNQSQKAVTNFYKEILDS